MFFSSFNSLVTYFKGEPLHYANDKDLPMLEQIPSYRKRLYPLEDIVQLLLFPGLHESQFTCSKVPTSIYQSASFIIDLDCLDSHKDILADDMGVWKNNRVDTAYLSVLKKITTYIYGM